jgi:hypothetical protein
MLQLLAMHPQGQGHQEIHHPQHGRVRRYPYVHHSSLETVWKSAGIGEYAVKVDIQY